MKNYLDLLAALLIAPTFGNAGFVSANAADLLVLRLAAPHTKWIPNEKFAGTSKHGTYDDVVQEIDWQVGELMETLDELGIAENTLVIFASDNGPQLNVEGCGSAGVLRDGKWTNFERGMSLSLPGV
jgi:arylsulfatase